MAWYWIVLIVLGYIVMWIIIGIFSVEADILDEDAIPFCALWPIVFPLLIIDWLAHKILYWIHERKYDNNS